MPSEKNQSRLLLILKKFRWTLFAKICTSLLLVSILPLTVFALLQSRGLVKTSEKLATQLNDSINRQTAVALEIQAQDVADGVSRLLKQCEEDLQLAVKSADSKKALHDIYNSRNETITRRWISSSIKGITERVPRYSSLELIDHTGKQLFVISAGEILPEDKLRNVSNAINTEFKNEDYFRKGMSLRPDEIFISHVAGFHVDKLSQLNGHTDPEEAIDGEEYRGVVRFAAKTPLRKGKGGTLVVLSLDHRHLMEFTQHILPGEKEPILFPSYKSGNYAFMFDDEGWIITHPKYWDIRGVDKNGRQVPAYSESSSKADVEQGKIPFNLLKAGFIHPNYPIVAQEIISRKSGYLYVKNVGGSPKVMAFAPISYGSGDYSLHGVFGGITIGADVDRFHEPAHIGVSSVNKNISQLHRNLILIFIFTVTLVVTASIIVSSGITRPLKRLKIQAEELAEGGVIKHVHVSSKDEIHDLAESFNKMAQELKIRKEGLLETLQQLEQSQHTITSEKNFKTSILDSISSSILTFTPDGILSSINGTGKKLLGENLFQGEHYTKVLSSIPEQITELEKALRGAKEFGRQSCTQEINGVMKHLDIGFFPIGSDAGGGITLTIRDETERERLREEMMRLDRLASLGKLSAGIAHEVRNPLTGISLLLDDLHDQMSANHEDSEMIAKALQEIERVERLMTSMLNYASPSAASFQLSDINAIILDITVLFRKSCTRLGIELVTELDRIERFLFDPDKIRQALINLIKNAIEAPDVKTVTIETASAGKCVTVTVTDDGQGIDDETLKYIFEPFFTRKSAGTGLGLSITQRIAEEHGGAIKVKSMNPQGTQFKISLPVERA